MPVMKKLLITSIFLFAVFVAFTQTKPKQTSTEKAPTQKEMQEMMKAAQKEIDNMSPEDKKMMEEMGIKIPDMNNVGKSVSGVSDAQLKQAFEDESRIVPEKDEAGIASISKIPLADATIPAFLKSTHTKILALLKPESKTLAEKLYTQLKSTGSTSDAIGNTAAGLWIMGRIQPALYIMGRVCTEDISNTDNLSNYASMLSMSGIEQSAMKEE